MITRNQLFNIVLNRQCTICEDNAIIVPRAILYDYECRNCKIFYAGMDYNPEMIYIGFEHMKNKKIIFLFENNQIKISHHSNLQNENNIKLELDKIPETKEKLDKIYNQVKKINIFS